MGTGVKGVVDCTTVLTFVLTLVVFFGHVVSFATKNWLESIPGHSEFIKLGVHEICFEDFRHPRGDFDQRYLGCYGYFDDYYLQIRIWLLPGWFVNVRTLVFTNVGVSIVCFFLGAIVLVNMLMTRCTKGKCSEACLQITLFLTASLMLAAGIINLIAVTRFYSNSYDREWLPRPEVNRFGYSFWLAVVVTAAGLFGFVTSLLAGILSILSGSEPRKPMKTSRSRSSDDVILSRR